MYNVRSEGRRFTHDAGFDGVRGGRCLIPVDGFYEYTTPLLAPGRSQRQSKRPSRTKKDKWLFTLARRGTGFGAGGPPPQDKLGEDLAEAFFCIAGLWRTHPQVGEAFTMLTCEPGPDIAPYHSRQVVLLPTSAWGDWLSGKADAQDLLGPTPAGTLQATLVSGSAIAPPVDSQPALLL